MSGAKRIMWGFVLILILTVCPVYADVSISELDSVMDKVSLGMDVSIFYRADKSPYYGGAIGTSDKTDASWGEIYSTIRLTAEKDLGWAKAEGQFAPFYSQTVDQDAYGVASDEGDIGMNQAWLKFGQLYGGPFDVTLGRQDLKLGNMLVTGDGSAPEQATWLNGNSSFPFAVRVDGNFGKLKSTLYWARTTDYAQKLDETALFGPVSGVEIAGLQGQYDFDESNFVFAGIHQKIDDEGRSTNDNIYLGPGLLAENNTLAWDVGANVTFAGLLLEAEVVLQTGDAGVLAGQKRDRDALGGFASVTYSFDTAFAPYLRGSYFYFSGDENPADDEANDYDPMFCGFGGWNRFVIGESVGELHLPNSNKKVALAEFGFSPAEMVFVSLMYLNHKLDENYWLFVPTTSDDWADEVNLLIDAPINDHLFAHVGFGWSKPGDAAIEVFGNDDDNYFAQVWLKYSF